MIGREELLKRIRAISPASDQKEWQYLKKILALLRSRNFPEDKEVLEEARKKML